MEDKYDHKKIEKKWQEKWEKKAVNRPVKMLPANNKFYNLWMFPYPSAEGLHAGHAFASTGSDVIGRYKRMKGASVFQPIGYDSFGIHSENYAIKTGKHPGKLIEKTTKNYERQLKSLGHGYDWTRTVTTSDIDYYRWTQWLFVEMFKAGQAYRKRSEVNWCPSCKTVLSDEQVTTPAQAGKEPKNAKGKVVKEEEGMQVCERCGTLVEKRELKQWFFRITDYADDLLEGLEKIDWPEKIKLAQRNWIGRKEGINIKYEIKDKKEKIVCWTSRPDTNFGATFIVVSPEYAKKKLLKILGKNEKDNISEYIKSSLNKSKEERIREGREKTGVFTGLYAVNQLNGYEMPVWVADFVLADVGTGAVVGVPGHDMRDFEFAKKYDLEIKRVVVGPDGDESEIERSEQVQEEEGKMVNSEFLNGMEINKAIGKIMDHLEEKGWGERTVNYHLRDWTISRQRYWGPPIPMIYCETCAKAGRSWFTVQGATFKGLHKVQEDWDHAGWYPEENLPVELPDIKDYEPEGEGKGPLANHPEFYKTKCPYCRNEATRETDVSDTFLDSAWYFLAYPMQGQKEWKKRLSTGSQLRQDSDGQAGRDVIGNKIVESWLPVDLYFGGAEHAVLHLMYARYVTMILNDLNYINFSEPFPRFYAHGLMIKDGAKMSKSRGNVVNPDEYIEKFGADTLRLYLMFMGPMDGYPDFRDTGIEGMRRFVERIWYLYTNHKETVVVQKEAANEILVKMHQTIKKVDKDIQDFKYNTAISSIMELVNLLRDVANKNKGHTKKKKGTNTNFRCAEWDGALKVLAQLLAPFAPHLAEEIWCELLGEQFSVHTSDWPKFNKELTKETEVTIPVQVNGKLRDTISMDAEDVTSKEKVVNMAKNSEKIIKWLEGKTLKNTIYVAGKLVNFVTN